MKGEKKVLSRAKIKFNNTSMKAIKPEAKEYTLWDSALTGFGVRVSPKGKMNFIYQGKLHGKILRISIGAFGQITPEQARKKADHLKGKISIGEDPRPKKPTEAEKTTFGDLLNAYVELLESQKKKSARAVGNQIQKDIQKAFPQLWKKRAADITLDDCVRIIGRLIDQGSPRQADKLRSYIKTAFSTAINSRGNANVPPSMRALNIQSNPASELVKVEGSSNAKTRALTLSEFCCYWKRVNALPEPERSIMRLHVLTGGQRQEQLSRVTLNDVDINSHSMTILDFKGRRAAARVHVVPLLPECVEAIRNLTGSGSYVLSCDGGISPVHNDYLNDVVRKIRAEMDDAGELEQGSFTAGTIRATVETRLAAKPYRINSDVLAQLQSHGLGGVQSRHYQHHGFFDEKLEALEMLHRMVERLPEPERDNVVSFQGRANA